jgi:hypothetical protein
MTNMSRKTQICGVCKGSVDVRIVDSTNEFGSKDLDLRPAEMMRSTYFTWCTRCPHCGYCASDITEHNQITSHIVSLVKYKQQLNDKSFPELANTFFCEALILYGNKNPVDAGFACLHAAWACDDAENILSAKESRQRASILFAIAKAEGKALFEITDGEFIFLADIERRSGEYDKAKDFCNDGLAKATDPNIIKILHYQHHLCVIEDSDAHTIEEAFDWKASTK